MAKVLAGRAGAIRRVAGAATAVAASVLLIAGCAAGQDAQTVNQRPAIDGASADAGFLSIRAAAVVADEQGGSTAKGGSALLQLVIINNGPQTEQLQSVTSPVASSAQVSNTGVSNASSASSEFPSASPSESGSPSATSSGSATVSAPGSSTVTGSPSSSATASSSNSAPATGSASATESPSATESAASTPIPIPAGQSVQVGFDSAGPNISLTGLSAELYPAQTVQVTFTFGSGATITLNIPVQLPSSAASAPVISDATEAGEPNS